MTKILAIETGFGKFSIALSSGSKIEQYHCPEDNKQAELLVPETEALLASQGISYQELDAIACNIGPASFTGIRIGVAFARTVASSLNIRQIAITSLEALANTHNLPKASLRAGRGQIYYQNFAGKSAPQLLDQSQAKSEIFTNITAKDVLDLALKKNEKGEFCDNLSPLYVRAPDAKIPTKLVK